MINYCQCSENNFIDASVYHLDLTNTNSLLCLPQLT